MLPERHQLALDTTPNEMLKVDEKFELTIRNADTYVWYALVSDSTRNTSDLSLLTQYASRTSRSRRYAQNSSPSHATRQETMTTLLTDDPTNRACDCDENDCTPDSRSCYANNSCIPYEPDNSYDF
jgi:hypothetical protein